MVEPLARSLQVSVPDTVLPAEPSEHWSKHRREIRDWLRKRAPSLAELYEGAVFMLYEENVPGYIRFVSHAVREIRNRLPQELAGGRAGKRLDYKVRLDQLLERWRSAGLSRVDPPSASLMDPVVVTTADSEVSIPAAVVTEVSKLLRDHEEVPSAVREKAAGLFEACAPDNETDRRGLRQVVDQWLEVTGWFLKRAHDAGKSDGLVDGLEFRKQFEVFEATLGALGRGFFATMKDIDEILEDTNS